MTGKLMNFGHAPVGFGLLGLKGGRLFEIMKSLRVLPGGLTFLREPESGAVEQVRRNRILRIQLVCPTKSLISRKVLAELKQRGPIEGVHLK
jgi:hypothetical protein